MGVQRKAVPKLSLTSAPDTLTINTSSLAPAPANTAASPLSAGGAASSKALPRPPPELESVDLVGSLEAQMADLALRRGNLSRLLRDTIKPQSENPLVSDLRVRRELQRRQKELEEEIADIGAQEHEIGLRLHRAWKRRDKDHGGESALWIKRVTS